MKTISNKKHPITGIRRVLVELQPGEELRAYRPDSHYQLGQPLEDMVVATHHIAEAVEVSWCVVEQKWRP